MNDLPEPARRRLRGSAPSPEVLQEVVTEGRRRRRKAWLATGGAGCAMLLAVVLAGTLTGGDHDALTVQPADTPTPQVTVSSSTSTPEPTPTTQPSGSSQPAARSLPIAAPDGQAVTLSAVGSLVSGQQGMLRLHVATADTWTAYVLSFNKQPQRPLADLRLFSSAGQPWVGDIDSVQLFDVCKAHADLTGPTNETRTFPFTPLAAGHFHAVIQVLHGNCSTESGGSAPFVLAGSHVITTTLDFTVEDSGWHFDANGPKSPSARISFERYGYDPHGPYLIPESSGTPGFEFDAFDPDGDLGAVTVDWGDGSAPEDIRHANVPGCYNGGVSGSMVYVPSHCIYQPDHTYAAAGRYPITLTVQSGAGTRNPQTTSVRAEWVDNGPATTPTPTPTPS